QDWEYQISEKQSNTSGNESSRSINECNDKSTSRDDTDIRPSYDTEPMVESIQTIHMLAPKGSTYNGRPTFENPIYLKKAQSEKPCLYEIPYDKSDLANMFAPDREKTLTLEQESRSKLNKDLVKPYDYTKQNSLYKNFKPPSREYLDQLAHANEVRKKM
ncbi:hypothetical protein Tco_1409739, partial [Tanacetum coccineum]